MSLKTISKSAVYVVLFGTSAVSVAADTVQPSITPFGSGITAPHADVIPAAGVKSQAIECMASPVASQWMVENPSEGQPTPFSIQEEGGKKILRIDAGSLVAARSTVRILLPGDAPANGEVWAKNKATYVSFLCKSAKPVDMTFHLLQRGKTAGTYQTVVSVDAGEWQRVVLPIQQFKLKNLTKISGFGFRVVSADKGNAISIADISVGGMAFSDDSWKSQRLAISLKGDWHFAGENGDEGMQQKWYASELDDSAWKVIKSGLSWQEQGVTHHGFGWYRQNIFVPKEMAGTPLTLTLTKIASDDDAWFNGVRIGGWKGEYKYDNQLLRTYTVPAERIHYGEVNSIAVRVWGGDLTFIGDRSGLTAGPLEADLDPYGVKMRDVGGQDVPADLFDLSDARQGKPFEIVIPFPSAVAKESGSQLRYRLTDLNGVDIKSGTTPLPASVSEVAKAVISIDRETAQAIYMRGRFQANLIIEDGAGNPVYSGTRKLDHLSFSKRDETALPALPDSIDETPYGKLKLVDEIDCSTSLFDDPHPYLQGGFEHSQDRQTPGSPVNVKVNDILGKKARESDYGWFAYRVGRGQLKPHSTYLVRIEYPEDKPRYAPVEFQTGQNFMDVGWKNGVAPDDVYDNWPLSKQWQWYDTIVPLDDESVGTGGVGSASATNGFWVYFLNKMKPNAYFSMYSGGPAVARIRLYEIDAEKNAPVIQRPQGVPNRVLSFDWERQPDHEPADFVRYAKLMGYSAISPVIVKWGTANYAEPLNGYMSVNMDDHSYWVKKPYDPKAGVDAAPALPGKDSEHVRYLAATKQFGLDYIPRFEWGGSDDLPREAWAFGVDGQPVKPNRFASWGANLLNPLAWEDLKKLMDHLIKPYVKDNPQMTGALWRIRSDRMPISYGRADVEMFATETNTKLPRGGDAQLAAWAAGEMKGRYDDWWHQKRAQFHIKLVDLLKSYRPDLTLYYYNWDEDKFGLIKTDLNAWGFLSTLGNDGRAAYEKDRALRKTFTAADYIDVLHTGNFGEASKGINRADYGLRPELYKGVQGIQLFAPANYLCYADMPDYLNYFRTDDGLAVSNVVSYDEVASRSINPKYEANTVTPANSAFSMAIELLAYFHGDARTLNYTVYTYGRGFADAHRRFAQAFLALPAIPGTVVDQGDKDVKVRTYATNAGTYLGVAYKGYSGKKLTIAVPAKPNAVVKDLVTNAIIPTTVLKDTLQFEINAGPMELDAFEIQ